MSPSVGENTIPLFDMALDETPTNTPTDTTDKASTSAETPINRPSISEHDNLDLGDHPDHIDHHNSPTINTQQATEPHWSIQISQPSTASLQSKEYQECEAIGQNEGQDLATT